MLISRLFPVSIADDPFRRGQGKEVLKRVLLLCWLLLPFMGSGCSLPQKEEFLAETGMPARTVRATEPPEAPSLQKVSFRPKGQKLSGEEPNASKAEKAPFPLAGELSVEKLVEEVLARNPTLSQMEAAWEAASARYPQVTSLDDPKLGLTFGPGSVGSNTVNPAGRVEIEQAWPFPGKRRLRGENALAEAEAAGHDVEDMRLQLIESAKAAFYDYYLVERALEVNAESLRLLQQAKQDSESRYKTGNVDQQDVLQADVEVGREREKQLALEETRQITLARINTLLHLPPDNALPPSPKEMKVADGLPHVQALRASALAQRPDLQALADHIQAEEAALALAYKEYCPDFETFFMFDRFMGNNIQSQDLAYMLGMKVNLPVRKARRQGAVAEAHAKIVQRQAELARQTDQVSFQVQEAYEKVRKSEKAVRLYEKTILPAALLNVKAARTAYATGKIPALTRIEAEKTYVGFRDRYYETVADYFRRRATLERVVGGPLAPGDLSH